MKPIHIQTEKIPEIELILLSASVLNGVMEHFNNPENQRRFKEWQEKRKKTRRRKTIKTIEQLEKAKELWNKGEHLNCNRTLLFAYEHSQEAETELLNFDEVIWKDDIAEIIANCKEYGIEEFTVSANFSGLLEALEDFEKNGCKLAGLVRVNRSTYHLNREMNGLVRDTAPAMKMKLEV